jgi:ribosomal-protein-alanine N-acetyltransferase
MTVIAFAHHGDCVAIAELSRTQIEDGLPWRWTPARVARAIADRATNVAVVRERDALIAFGIMKYADDAAHLLLLAVDPAHRRSGIGTALLRWLEVVARGAGLDVIRLEARDDNPAARAFYRHNGYRELRQVAGMYCGLKNGVHLERNFPSASLGGEISGFDERGIMDVKDIVKGNQVRFLHYRQGFLYYAVAVPGEAAEFMFPVPVGDIGDATLQARDTAILFLRYIRKAMEEGSFVPLAAQ